MPRIAVLHPDLGIGGAERLIVDISLALKQYGQHEVDVYTNFHDRQRCFNETRNGQLNVIVACSWFPRNFLGRFNAFCAYMRFVFLAIYVVYLSPKRNDYDLFVCDQISACIPFLRGAHRSVLFYCHFPDKLLTKRESFVKKLYRLPIDTIEVYTTCLADRILVNSAYTQSIFKDHISSTTPVEILYPTIPDSSALPSVNENTKSTVFLSINRFERKKDLALALRAFAHLRTLLDTRSSAIHLFVIGGYDARLRENVEYFDELEQLAIDLQLDPSQITFVKSFSDEQKRDYLAQAHCILYTPRNEHFGIVPLEAMQAGRPVIATATGGPLETIVDERTGFLCREPLVEIFAERMKRFVDDKQLSTRMGNEGRRHVNENFAFRPFAEKLNSHVEEMLSEERATARTVFFWLFTIFICIIGWIFIRKIFF